MTKIPQNISLKRLNNPDKRKVKQYINQHINTNELINKVLSIYTDKNSIVYKLLLLKYGEIITEIEPNCMVICEYISDYDKPLTGVGTVKFTKEPTKINGVKLVKFTYRTDLEIDQTEYKGDLIFFNNFFGLEVPETPKGRFFYVKIKSKFVKLKNLSYICRSKF